MNKYTKNDFKLPIFALRGNTIPMKKIFWTLGTITLTVIYFWTFLSGMFGAAI